MNANSSQRFTVCYYSAGCVCDSEPVTFDSLEEARDYVREEFESALEAWDEEEEGPAPTLDEEDVEAGLVEDPREGSLYAWSIEPADDDDEDEDEDEDDANDDDEGEPEEEDWIIDHKGNVGQVGGSFLGKFTEHDDALLAIDDAMTAGSFFPNVWVISDHGNSCLIRDFAEQVKAIRDARADDEGEAIAFWVEPRFCGRPTDDDAAGFATRDDALAFIDEEIAVVREAIGDDDTERCDLYSWAIYHNAVATVPSEEFYA